MRLALFRSALIACCLAIAAPIGRLADRLLVPFVRALEADAVALVRFVVGAPRLALELGPVDQVEPSLQHRLRHEAGVARMSAPRHI